MITRRDRILAAISRHAARTETEAAEEYHSRDRNPATRRKPRGIGAYPLEADEQKTVVKFLRDRGEIVVSPLNGAHLAGGGLERVKKWGQLVALGAKKGAPDLTWYRAGGAPVLIEMKRQRAAYGSEKAADAATDSQRRLHDELRLRGYMVLVAYGAVDAIAQMAKLIKVTT